MWQALVTEMWVDIIFVISELQLQIQLLCLACPFLLLWPQTGKKKDLSQIKAVPSISESKWKKKLGEYLNLIYNLEPNPAQYNPQSNPKPSCNMNNRKKLSLLKPIKVLGLCSYSRSWQLNLTFLWYFCTIFFYWEWLSVSKHNRKIYFFTFLILKNSQVAFVYIKH